MSGLNLSLTKIKADIAAAGIGTGQAWQDLKLTRDIGVTYTNTSGKAIFVTVSVANNNINGFQAIYVDNVVIGTSSQQSGVVGRILSQITVIVPNSSSYKVTNVVGVATVNYWSELR